MQLQKPPSFGNIESQIKRENRSWITQLESVIDRTIAIFNPKAAIRRGLERERYHKFNYEAARPGTWRQQASLTANASPDTPTLNYDRIRMIWETRDLEQNFPFIPKLISVIEDYVLGDFRMKSKASSEQDRAAIEDYWQLACNFMDPQGRETFHDLSRLALHGTVRDGDGLGVFELSEFKVGNSKMEFYQIYLIEADRIGYPYESSYGNGYLNGVYYDINTGFITGYHVYQRDPVSNSYSNPQIIESNKCLYIGYNKRADALRCPSELASCIATARDIQEIIENERLAEKWLTSQGGVVTTLTGDQATDTDIYNDPYQSQSPYPSERLQSARPAAMNYLAPGEEFKAFEFNRPSPAFLGLLEALYRDCCMALSLPFGFVYKPTTNGIAARLESAQAKRTFQRWQRIMRDKWLLPIWNRVMIHGVQTGQLKISPQGQAEISKVKIIWPAHPSVDVGRESTANVAEFNANLKAAESITEERGDDYDEMMDQKKYEAMKERQTIGLIESVINNLGPKGADGLFQLYGQVSSGEIPPENGRLMLQTLFGMTEEEALQAIPENFKVNQPVTTTTTKGSSPTPANSLAIGKFGWITTESGNHVFIDENGNATKGNPHVIKDINKGSEKSSNSDREEEKKVNTEKSNETPKKAQDNFREKQGLSNYKLAGKNDPRLEGNNFSSDMLAHSVSTDPDSKQASLIRHWSTRAGFQEVNGYPDSENSKETVALVSKITPDQNPGALYRGMKFDDEDDYKNFIKSAAVGKTLEFNNPLTSTTGNSKMAEGFAQGGINGTGVIMQIDSSKSSRNIGKSIDSIDSTETKVNSGQDERVFLSGSKFRVKSIQKYSFVDDNGETRSAKKINLEEL